MEKQNETKKLKIFTMLAFKNTPMEKQVAMMNSNNTPSTGSVNKFNEGFNPWEALIVEDDNVEYTSTGTEHGLLVKATFQHPIGVCEGNHETVLLRSMDMLLSVEDGEPPYLKYIKPC